MLALVKDGVVHFIPLQAVQIILICPVHLKVIWAVHLKCCNHLYIALVCLLVLFSFFSLRAFLKHRIPAITPNLEMLRNDHRYSWFRNCNRNTYTDMDREVSEEVKMKYPNCLAIPTGWEYLIIVLYNNIFIPYCILLLSYMHCTLL